MRTIALAGSVLALTGLGVAPALASQAAPSAADTHRERGIVLECTGEADGLSAYVDLYENDVYTNYFQVVLNDDPQLARSREPDDILAKGEVRAAIRIKGHTVRVTGTASRVGKRKHVHEEIEDAGNTVVSDGFHRRLRNDLVLKYRGTTVPLHCAPAFYYDLQVTTTPVE
jgi:hypothetical protein